MKSENEIINEIRRLEIAIANMEDLIELVTVDENSKHFYKSEILVYNEHIGRLNWVLGND